MNSEDVLTLQRVQGHSSLAMKMKYADFSSGRLTEGVDADRFMSPREFGGLVLAYR